MKISNRIQKLFLAVATSVVLTAAAVHAAEVAGNYTWTTPGRNGGPDRVSTLTLAVQDSKLTGKVSVPGRDGQAIENPIIDGKVDGDKVTFAVVRQANGNAITNSYSGTVAADKISGKIEFTRNGEAQSRDWEAKRTTDTK